MTDAQRDWVVIVERLRLTPDQIDELEGPGGVFCAPAGIGEMGGTYCVHKAKGRRLPRWFARAVSESETAQWAGDWSTPDCLPAGCEIEVITMTGLVVKARRRACARYRPARPDSPLPSVRCVRTERGKVSNDAIAVAWRPLEPRTQDDAQ